MLKVIALGTTVLLLGGCALPVPLQIASWVLDGVSVLTTQKSVADHGISLLAEKDCAVWRGVVEGEFCRDEIDPTVMVADGGRKPEFDAGFNEKSNVLSPVSRVPVTDTALKQQVIVDRREVGVKFSHAMSRAKVSAPRRVQGAQPVQAVRGDVPSSEAPIETQAQGHSVVAAKWSPPIKPKIHGTVPVGGIYFVIGSFRSQQNALRLSGRHQRYAATTISAKLDGKKIYRVVVGPIEKGKGKTVHKNLRNTGLTDTWAIRVNASEWTVAGPIPRRNTASVNEVASLAE